MRLLFLSVLFVLSSLFFSEHIFASKASILDSLNKQSKSDEIYEQQAAFMGLAEYYYNKNEQRSEEYLNKVLTNINDIPNDFLRKLLERKINFFEQHHRIDDLLETSEIALKESNKRKDTNLMAFCHKTLASGHFKKFNFKHTKKHLIKASKLYQALGDQNNIGSIILQKGRLEYAKGNYTKAFDEAIIAADIFKRKNQNKQLALTYLQLGNMHYFLSELQQAANYYSLASDYYLMINDSLGWAMSHSNFGLVKLDQDSFASALAIQYEALPTITRSNREISIGNTYHYIGESYIGLKQADSAEKYIRKSATINKKSKYFIGNTFDKIALGKIALLRGNIDSAIYYGKQANKALDSIHNFELQKQLSLFFMECYKQKGEPTKALEHLSHHVEIIDSFDISQKDIKTRASTEQSKIERAEYELKLSKQRELIKKQENESQQFLIIILSIITIVSIFFAALIATTNRRNKSLNRQLKDKQKRLKVELNNKQALLKEIHHRVKNNLQIISSMLSIQSKYVEDETMHHILKESQSRIKSMALIHESLYKREKDEHSLFSTYVKSLIPNLIETYHVDEHKIRLEMDVEDIELSLDDSIPCGLIINEIVSNSLKHAFPEGKEGKIIIKMKRKGENIQLFIADNGVGFPSEQIDDNSDSFGFLLIESLANQLEASLENKTKNGVSYLIEWRAKNDKLLD